MVDSSRGAPPLSLYRTLAVRLVMTTSPTDAGTRVTETIETMDNDTAAVMLHRVDGRDGG
jgi:hypothetical protein